MTTILSIAGRSYEITPEAWTQMLLDHRHAIKGRAAGRAFYSKKQGETRGKKRAPVFESLDLALQDAVADRPAPRIVPDNPTRAISLNVYRELAAIFPPPPPPPVEALEQEDDVARFMSACLELTPGSGDVVAATDLYNAYVSWFRGAFPTRKPPRDIKAFAIKLRGKGLSCKRTSKCIVYLECKLNAPEPALPSYPPPPPPAPEPEPTPVAARPTSALAPAHSSPHATKQRQDMEDYVRECIVLGEGLVAKPSELASSYRTWLVRRNLSRSREERAPSMQNGPLYEALTSLPGVKRVALGGGYLRYEGVALRSIQ